MNAQCLFSQSVAVIGIIWSNMNYNSNYIQFFNASENSEYRRQHFFIIMKYLTWYS